MLIANNSIAILWYAASILAVACCPNSAFAQGSESANTLDASENDKSNDQGTTQQKVELLFLDPDGKPLPPEVQAQLRESFDARRKAEAENSNSITVRSRAPRGSIKFDVAPERSFSPLELRAFGAANVDELIDALDNQISYSASGNDGRPVLLLNGRRVSNPLDIAVIPTEAIERVDVLPEQLAAQYGGQSDRKVVNIVTYESFSALTALGLRSIATEGGYAKGSGALDLFSIVKNTRYGLGARYDRTGNLTEAERGILQPIESTGLGAFRTLLPRTEKISLNGNVARPLGGGVDASISGRYESNHSNGLAGALDGSVITTIIKSQELSIGFSASTQIERFLLSLNGLYFDSSETAFVARRDSGDLLDSSNLDEYVLTGDLSLTGPLVELPGGFLSVAATIGGGRSQINANALSALSGSDNGRARATGRVSLSIDIPVLAAESSIGRLSTGFDLGLSTFSDVRDTRRVGANIRWSPSKSVQLGVTSSSEHRVPSLEQLGQPTLISPNVRNLDFISGETVDVDVLTGGNAQLKNEKLENFRFRLGYRPFRKIDLSLSFNFYSTSIKNPISSFPLLTLATVNAFPNRFHRDANGALRSIDVRPVNFEKRSRDRFLWGISFSRPLGPVPTGSLPQGQDITSVEDAKQAFPDAVILTSPSTNTSARESENLASRLFFNLYHSWFVRDEVTLATNTLPLDLLAGDAIEFLGGRRRHRIELDAGIYNDGLGVRIGLDWNSPTSLIGSSVNEHQDLRFGGFAIATLSAFANLAEAFDISKPYGLLGGMRGSLIISNVFNRRPPVLTNDRITPLRFQSPFLDPLGRTVSISFRKIF